MIVAIVPSPGPIVSEQGGNRLRAVRCVRQEPNSLLIRLIDHHVLRGQIPIVAAKTQENSADFLRTACDRAGQDFSEFPTIAKRYRCAVQWASVLSPQCITARIRRALLP